MGFLILALAAGLIGLLGPIIYNVFFHPLRHFPGPRMAGATTWWKAYKEVFQQETLAKLLFGYHEKHGKIEQAKQLRDDIVLTHIAKAKLFE